MRLFAFVTVVAILTSAVPSWSAALDPSPGETDTFCRAYATFILRIEIFRRGGASEKQAIRQFFSQPLSPLDIEIQSSIASLGRDNINQIMDNIYSSNLLSQQSIKDGVYTADVHDSCIDGKLYFLDLR